MKINNVTDFFNLIAAEGSLEGFVTTIECQLCTCGGMKFTPEIPKDYTDKICVCETVTPKVAKFGEQ